MTNPNRVHAHHFELKGGPTFWAECACGEKLTGDSGVIVGSKGKVEAACMVANVMAEAKA